MALLDRTARWLARTFPRHVTVPGHAFEAYPRAPRVGVLFTLAQQDALAYGHVHATPERVMLAALEDPGVAAHLAARGADLERLRSELLVALASSRVADEARAVPRPTRTQHTLGQALERMRRRGAKVLSRGDVLAGLAATEGATSRLLAALPIAPAELDADDEAPLPPAAAAGDARVRVFVLNDDVSTMDDVMRILEQGFGLPVRTACHRTLATHVLGHAELGEYPRSEADALLDAAARQSKARRSSVRFFVARAG